MIDTHAHLGMCEPGDGELVAAAREAGVDRILTVGIDHASNDDAVRTAEAHEEVYACVGRHPNSASGFDERAVVQIEELAENRRARRTELPLVIHMRDSVEDTFALLGSRADGITVILHCFSAPAERVAEVAERGWYCSFAGNLTYPRAESLRDAGRLVPRRLLLVETDSPFLAPQPQRGKPNQPANVVATARQLADVRGIPYEELEEAVEENAARVFGW